MLIFEPQENLTAYELWQVLRMFEIPPIKVNEKSVPEDLKQHFEPTEDYYGRFVKK